MALLGFQNVIRLDGLNSDIETRYFTEVVTLKEMYPPFHTRFFQNVNLWESCIFGPCRSTSCDVVITLFGHYVNLASIPGNLALKWNSMAQLS